MPKCSTSTVSSAKLAFTMTAIFFRRFWSVGPAEIAFARLPGIPNARYRQIENCAGADASMKLGVDEIRRADHECGGFYSET